MTKQTTHIFPKTIYYVFATAYDYNRHYSNYKDAFDSFQKLKNNDYDCRLCEKICNTKEAYELGEFDETNCLETSGDYPYK